MKEQEKQIEEMAKALLEYIKVYGKLHLTVDGIDNTARLFEKFGITKLPEDSVVLSREEYDSYHKLVTELTIKNCKARKETAEKILNAIYDKLNTFEAVYEIDYESYVDDVLWEIAKQFGVEIKE
jgi:hypothetical protein